MIRFVRLLEKPEIKEMAASWFHEKWGVPEEAYLACMDECQNHRTEYGWYLALDGERIAGTLLNLAMEDLRHSGISPVYLVTDLTGFYERYGWEFLGMVREEGEPGQIRMYVHR